MWYILVTSKLPNSVLCESKTAFNVNWFRIETVLESDSAYTPFERQLHNNVADVSTIFVQLKEFIQTKYKVRITHNSKAFQIDILV